MCRIRIARHDRVGFIDGMTQTIDELGPVDYVVIEFPGNKFNGEIAPALGDLIDRKLVKVLDLVFLTKDADGAIEGFELGDLDVGVVGEIEKLEVDVAHLLSEDDIANVAEALEPDSSAAVLVWENRWAAPFGAAVRHSGGQLVASGRIPTQALIAALETTKTKEPDMPLARRRIGGPGVVGPAPVARTAAVVGTAAVVSHWRRPPFRSP